MTLRYYQEDAVNALFQYFAAEPHSLKRRNPIVAMPTGTGKSHVIAEFIRRAMSYYPDTRVMMLTHVKELIEQNAAKLLQAWPAAPLGIYSAGLNSRENHAPIVFGGVKSVAGKFPMFGRRDLLIIDECHLVSPKADTQYLKVIGELTGADASVPKGSHNANPYLKVIGLTATPYRLGLGCMTNGPIFTDIAYNLCERDAFVRLINEGYLSALIPRHTQTQIDLSNVKIVQGEYDANQLQAAVDKERITYAALKETMELGHNRKSWLVFATGIDHAEHICEMLNTTFNVPTAIYHSKRPDKDNAKALADWKAGKVRAIVNMNALTTGVDNPECDLIVMLRPTMSPGLWIQMLGRGTRIAPGKSNCLALDFAGNTARLGPINDPVIPSPKGSKGAPKPAPVRICPNCSNYCHISSKECVICGFVFPVQEKIKEQASDKALVAGMDSAPVAMQDFEVQHVVLSPHTSRNSGQNSIRVAYFVHNGQVGQTYFEYISVESPSQFFRHKSRQWWNKRSALECPKTNAEVLAAANTLCHPRRIKVAMKQPPEVINYEF